MGKPMAMNLINTGYSVIVNNRFCVSCKNIRDDSGYWNQIEGYIRERSEAEISHSFCPECAKKLYPELYNE